jgi:hypothetical protein
MLFHFIRLDATEFYENVITSGSKDIDTPLYPKPEMPLGRFALQQTTGSSFRSKVTALMSN